MQSVTDHGTITWLGHSTWWIVHRDFRLLIDPFLTNNPAARTKAIDLDPTHILISHGHFDHIDDAVAMATKSSSQLIANYEIATWLSQKHGLKNAIGMNLGGTLKTSWGAIKMTQAVHSSSLPDGSYGGTAGGFMIEFRAGVVSPSSPYRVYFTGDTALFSDLQLIGRAEIDLLIVPIGDLYTMGPEDSLVAIQLVSPKWVLPTHYNTWPTIAQDAAIWASGVTSRTTAKPMVLAVDEAWPLP